MNLLAYKVRSIIRRCLFVLLVILCISCTKEKEEVKPQPLTNLPVSLKILPGFTNIKTAELIILEPKGKKLLDTVVSTYQQHTFKLKTLEKNFTVTTIWNNEAIKKTFVTTYYEVNPDKWELSASLNYPYFRQEMYVPKKQASLKYWNIPHIPDDRFYFTTPGEQAMSLGYASYLNILDIEYQRERPNYTYLVIPSLGLYKMHQVSSNIELIDLSQMEKATTVNFETPANLTKRSVLLNGYPNEKDYSENLMLYLSGLDQLKGNYDLIYPNNHIKKYSLNTSWLDADNNVYEYFSFSNTVPTKLSFLDDSHLKVTSKTLDNLGVQFTKDLPTYHKSVWDSKDLAWTVYLPSNKTSYQPLEQLNSLNSSLLNNRNLSDLKLINLTIEKADELTYQEFFNNVFNNDINKVNKITLSRRFTKNIN